MKISYLASIAMLMAITSVGFAGHHEAKNEADIVETAIAAEQFQTLVSAAKAAGLAEALKGEGPLTVFAPTDTAFKALPEGTVESLLKPENKNKLASILKYHVIAGSVTSDIAIKAGKAKTLEGAEVTISQSGSQLMVNHATVVKADIPTSNGVIHVIDKVLLPE